MSQQAEGLAERLADVARELRADLEQRRREFGYRIERGRVEFDETALAAQRAARERLSRFLRRARPLVLLTAPVIYGLILPLALLDLAVVVYQAVCFPVYRIKPVRRGDFVYLDRHQLAYLNGLQKLNCIYCGYANGVIAFAREVAARTEAYWCPIKHSRHPADPHAHYPGFVEFGDGQGFRPGLERNRAVLRGRR